ncbi:MAG: SGNH/GDSL hydrolase family protein [Christensenellales bacterium]|jgi:acyl-CoA thioesterase-1
MLKRILVVGDSLSKGVIVDENKKKYTLLKDCFFNLLAGNINADMYNASRFGSTVIQGQKQLESKIDKVNPDIVVLEFGGNDCDFLWDDIAKDPSLDHIPKTPLDIFEKSINSMIDFIIKKGKKPVLATLPPLYADSYFKWFTNSDKEKGLNILKWLKDIWRIYWWHERYSNCIQYISKERNINCIDVRREFLKRKEFSQYICSDGIHPNQAGHRLIFEAVINHIKQYASYLLPSYTL